MVIYCKRCFKQTIVTVCSWFNTDMICLECSNKERLHPDFENAKRKALDAEKNGNYNYEGIGSNA